MGVPLHGRPQSPLIKGRWYAASAKQCHTLHFCRLLPKVDRVIVAHTRRNNRPDTTSFTMTSDPHESAEHRAMAPAADLTDPGDRTKPRIKIGSQRAGAPPPRVPPRVKTVFSTPDPESS